MSREGSVKRDKESGRWTVVIDLTAPGAAQRKQIRRRGFKTKKLALEELDAIKRQLHAGQYVEPTRLTVGGYLVEKWLPSLTGTIRPTTHDTYRRLVRAHLVPGLGEVLLQQLDRQQVAAWLGDLTASGMSAKSVRNVHGVLSKALADAVENDLLSRNAATRAKSLPQVNPRPPRAWTVEQLGLFLSSTEGERFGVLWRFIAMTGCRRGEALGLRWADLNVEARTVTITNQRTVAGGTVVEGPPKTRAGARTIALDEFTVAALREWRAQQLEERLVMGAGWPKHDLVFTNPDGRPVWPQRVTQEFREIAADLELPLIGVHGLRHSAATAMIASGLNPRIVQQRLGHANVGITLSLYTHVMPGHDRDAADSLAQAVGREERRDHSVTRKSRKGRSSLVNMVRPVGVEPTTCGLRVRCSAGLS